MHPEWAVQQFDAQPKASKLPSLDPAHRKHLSSTLRDGTHTRRTMLGIVRFNGAPFLGFQRTKSPSFSERAGAPGAAAQKAQAHKGPAIIDLTNSAAAGSILPAAPKLLPMANIATAYYFADEDAPPRVRTSDCEPLFVSDTVDSWKQRELHSCHNGLVVKRPFNGMWDSYQDAIDDEMLRERIGGGLDAEVELRTENLRGDLQAAVGTLLATAALPSPLSEQIESDACSIGCAVGSMCASARALELRLQLFGENVCTKMHVDHIVGRALVSYTGVIGTEYTRDSNVDFHELEHCGNNDCILRDKGKVQSIEVGSMLFMKGRFYKGSNPLVHRSPAPRHHADGRVLNRLILKVDVLGGC